MTGPAGPAGPAGPTGTSGGRLDIDLRPITGTAATWTNKPAALTGFLGTTAIYQKRADLSGSTEARVKANQTALGASGALLKVQFSGDGAAWSDLCAIDAASTGSKLGAWAALPAGAKADVHIRLVGIGGNATADPAWHHVTMEAR